MDSILAITVSYLDDRLYDPKQSDSSDVFQVQTSPVQICISMCVTILLPKICVYLCFRESILTGSVTHKDVCFTHTKETCTNIKLMHFSNLIIYILPLNKFAANNRIDFDRDFDVNFCHSFYPMTSFDQRHASYNKYYDK